MIAAIAAVVILLAAGTTLGIYFSGIIDGFGPTEYVSVPDLTELTAEEARDILKEKELSLDSDIIEVVTDDAEDGAIVEQSPKAGKQVSKGSKVTITISSGNYYVIEDYTGRNLNVVEDELESHDITVVKEYQSRTDVEPGTIIEQSILNEGEKIKPGVSKQIKFIVASSPNFVMSNYTGARVDTAKSTLEEMGAKVKTEVISTEGMSEDELEDLEYNIVIRQSPEAGTYYEQSGDNVVTLYYYAK